MVLLAVLFYRQALKRIKFSERELSGVSYLRSVFTVLDVAQKMQLQTLQATAKGTSEGNAAFGSARSQVLSRLQSLQTATAAAGDPLGTTESITSVRSAAEALAAPSEGLFKVYATQAKLARSLVQLINSAADGSSLTLDPDLDTYYLMSGGVLAMPRLQDAIA